MENTNELRPGYIFICDSSVPEPYRISHCGAYGYFAKLDPENINGYEPVTWREYMET